MKIAFLSRYPPAECGIAEYTWFLVNSLRDIRKDLEILVIANKDVPLEEVSEKNVIRAFVSGVTDYSGVIEALRSFKPSILHIQHDYSFFPQSPKFIEFLEKARRLCEKIVITMHTVKRPIGIVRAIEGKVTFGEGAKEDLELVLFQRKLVNLSDAVIVHSYLQELELWMQGVEYEKVKVVPHGTLLNPYCSKSKSEILEDLAREGIEVPEGAIVFLPGFIRPDKGLDVAMKVYDIVSKEIEFTLILGGAPQGAESRSLRERLASMASRRARVVFLEKFIDRETMLKIFAISDAVILPYREVPGLIGVSGVLHLAIGSFKPLVCTRVPRLVEYCERVPELCAKQDDVMEFAYKLTNLLENLERYTRELSHVWRYALDTSWSRIAVKHLEVYGIK